MPSAEPDSFLLKAALAVGSDKLAQDADLLDFVAVDVLGSEDPAAFSTAEGLHSDGQA